MYLACNSFPLSCRLSCPVSLSPLRLLGCAVEEKAFDLAPPRNCLSGRVGPAQRRVLEFHCRRTCLRFYSRDWGVISHLSIPFPCLFKKACCTICVIGRTPVQHQNPWRQECKRGRLACFSAAAAEQRSWAKPETFPQRKQA